MEKRTRKQGDPAPEASSLAEIQARLEMIEDDMAQPEGDREIARRRAADVSEEADEIGRLLEELMTPKEAANPDSGAPNLDQPEETPDMKTLFREEDDQADQLAASEAARQRNARHAASSREPSGNDPT